MKVFNKKYLLTFSIILGSIGLLFLSIFLIDQKKIVYQLKASSKYTKPITGTFFMNDFHSLDDSYLKVMISEMKQTGIDTIIFLASGSLESNCNNPPVFNEKYLFDQESNNTRLLKLAKLYNMTVYIGLVSQSECIHYWEGEISNTNTNQGRLIDYSLRLIDQLKTTLKNNGWNWDNPAFAGFYIPQENGINTFKDKEGLDIKYYRALSYKIKQKAPNKKILLSPWKKETDTYKDARAEFENLFNKTSIDVIAPQDSIGTKKVTSFQKNQDHYRALKDAVNKYPGREAWANVEAFILKENEVEYDPTTINILKQQISTSNPYVSKTIIWIYQHTMLSSSLFDSLLSWSNSYTPEKAVKRNSLRNAYLSEYVQSFPTNTPQPSPTSSSLPTPFPSNRRR